MNWKSLLRNKQARYVALAVLAVAAAGGVSLQQALSRPAMLPVLFPIERGDVTNNVEATGTVDAVTTVNVGCQVSGMVKKILVDFNSPVKRGQVLMRLEDSPFVAAVKEAEANLADAQAAVRVAEAAIEAGGADLDAAKAEQARTEALSRQASIDYQRTEALFQQGVAAAAGRDQLGSAADSARAAAVAAGALAQQAQARIATAQAQLLQAQANEKQKAAALDQARISLSYTVITSPVSGTVVARNIDVGQTVASQLAAPNLFNIAQDLEQMYVYTKLDVRDVPRVREGMAASFAVDAFPGRVWEGKVTQMRINPITSLKGQAAPSQLGQATASAIPGLQTTSSSQSGPAGASTGATAISAPSVGVSSGSSSSSSGTRSSSGPGLVQYDALIRFRNPDSRLLPGMTAYVTIPFSAVYNVLRVRKEALRSSPSITLEEKNRLLKQYQIPSGANVVWVEEGARYRPVVVTVGTTDYLYAELTSGAVKEGDRVLAGYKQQEQ